MFIRNYENIPSTWNSQSPPLLVLGLSALVSENSVQTEGGKHLCTLCGKVVRAIRQHIRGWFMVKSWVFEIDFPVVSILGLLSNFHSWFAREIFDLVKIVPRTSTGLARRPTFAPPAACPKTRGTPSSCTCMPTIPTGGVSSWTRSRSRVECCGRYSTN